MWVDLLQSIEGLNKTKMVDYFGLELKYQLFWGLELASLLPGTESLARPQLYNHNLYNKFPPEYTGVL
jgi:hypothetical protein